MRWVLFTVPNPTAVPPGHAGYLAGRYRDGAYSDLWTDASRCAENTFVGYAPRCSCGWRGAARPADPVGRLSCQREWLNVHVVDARSAVSGRGSAAGPEPTRRRDQQDGSSGADLRRVVARSARS